MRRAITLLLAGVLTISFALPAHASFRSLTREISRTPNFDRMWIPFFGLGRLVVRVAHPRGVHDVKLAVFETESSDVDIDLASLLRRHVDTREWSPMTTTRSRDEEAHIFFQERGENVGLLLAVRDRDEVVVMEIELDAERFIRALAEDVEFRELTSEH